MGHRYLWCGHLVGVEGVCIVYIYLPVSYHLPPAITPMFFAHDINYDTWGIITYNTPSFISQNAYYNCGVKLIHVRKKRLDLTCVEIENITSAAFYFNNK